MLRSLCNSIRPSWCDTVSVLRIQHVLRSRLETEPSTVSVDRGALLEASAIGDTRCLVVELAEINHLSSWVARGPGALAPVALVGDGHFVLVAAIVIADQGGRTSTLLALHLLLDPHAVALALTHEIDELEPLFRVEAVRLAVLERNRRRGTLDEAFNLEVPLRKVSFH